MNIVAVVRGLKVVAILCFLLPWLLVSCQGHSIGVASGADLALGHVTIHDPMNGSVQTKTFKSDIFVVLSFAIIVLGLILGTIRSGRNALNAMSGTSVMAAVLAFVGAQVAISYGKHVPASDATGASFETAAMGLFTVSIGYGLYLTILALAAAALLCFLVNRDGQLIQRGLIAFTQKTASGSDDDVGFWDGLPSKTDHDGLEEYLTRFPKGKFSNLARKRLGLADTSLDLHDASVLGDHLEQKNALDVALTVRQTMFSEEQQRAERSPTNRGVTVIAIAVLSLGAISYFAWNTDKKFNDSPAVSQSNSHATASEAAAAADEASRAADAAAADAARAAALPPLPPSAQSAAQSADQAAGAAASAAQSAVQAAEATNNTQAAVGSGITYTCTFAPDRSNNPIVDAANTNFTIDESRDCINDRAAYYRNPDGTLTKIMTNDAERRISYLRLTPDRSLFARADLIFDTATYNFVRQQAKGMSKVACPVPADSQALESVQQTLGSYRAKLMSVAKQALERKITVWTCAPP